MLTMLINTINYILQNEDEQTYNKYECDMRRQCPETAIDTWVPQICLQVYAESMKEVFSCHTLAIQPNKQREAVEESERVLRWFNRKYVSRSYILYTSSLPLYFILQSSGHIHFFCLIHRVKQT